jgi:hypothetical protein
MKIQRSIDGYERKDLLTYVFAHCVSIEQDILNSAKLQDMQAWCEKELCEERAGNIIQEAMWGWLDYFEGDWCFIYDDLHDNGDWVFWFANKSDMTRFQLTWL